MADVELADVLSGFTSTTNVDMASATGQHFSIAAGTGGQVVLPSIPTTDPSVADAVWASDGNLVLSGYTPPGGGTIDVQNAGTPLGTFSTLNFTGATLADGGGGVADITITGGGGGDLPVYAAPASTDVSITSGNGTTSGNGAQFTIASGLGGSTAGNGGNIFVNAGYGQGAGFNGANGGSVELNGGNGGTSSLGGGVTLSGGLGGNAGGSIALQGGNGVGSGTRNGGDITATGGNGQASGTGGNIALTGGPAAAGSGGAVTITSGSSISGTCGDVTIEAATNGTDDGNMTLIINGGSPGTGVFRIAGLPTSSAGLPSGAIWSDSGTLKIVP